MAEAFIVEAVRTAGRQEERGALQGASGGPRSARAQGARRARRRSTRAPWTTSSSVASTSSDRRPGTSRGRPGCRRACPTRSPGVTVDRQCGSSQQALHFAAQAVMSGTSDLGRRRRCAEHESHPDRCVDDRREAVRLRAPVCGRARVDGAIRHRRSSSQFRSAEMIAEKWGLSRHDMEAYALESHRRAIRAIDEGRFDARDRPARRDAHRRGTPPRYVPREDGDAPAARRPMDASRRRCRARSPTARPRSSSPRSARCASTVSGPVRASST